MKKYTAISLTSFLIILDQLIKWWMINYRPSFVLENRGIIFGFIENQTISYLLLAIGFGILIWLIYKTRLSVLSAGRSLIAYRLSLTLIIAGALSNLIDRLFRGYVVDYINFLNLNHFNLADIYIIVGVILYMIIVLTQDKN